MSILHSTKIYAEEAITEFDENMAINFFGNYKMGVFAQNDSKEYATDLPWNGGVGIRYKDISAQISVPVSFNDWAFDFEISSYFDKIYFEGFLKHYKKLYDEDFNEQSDLDIVSSGIRATWVNNHTNHSLSSVLRMDKKQNASSGSLLYGFGVFYSSIHSKMERIERYIERQHLMYFGPSIGYSYIWVFSNGIFINLSLNLLPNLGINTNKDRLLFAPQWEPRIIFGHHNHTWSINLIMMNNCTVLLWNKNDYDMLQLISVTIMFSKRL